MTRPPNMVYDDRATWYAKKVLSGDIVAGLYVRLACQRHLEDFDRLEAQGFYYDPEKAEHAIDFYPSVLTITEGELAGEPFNLLPWHVFTTGNVFGWRDKNDLRRFRFVWLETGKGQAKSPYMAATGIYMAGFAGMPRSEAYCIGETKDTARVMFRDAVAMCRGPIPGREESLERIGKVKIRGTGDLAYKIEFPDNDGRIEPVANIDTISGPKPNIVKGDEVHEMKSNASIETWRAALDKRPGDPLMMLGTNTPSVDQIVGTDYSTLVQKILKREFIDESVFGYIARVDKDDDPFNDETCWIKALPALGITFPIENIRKRVASSKLMISTRRTTERLYFGKPTGVAGFWINEAAWDKAQGSVNENDMIGRRLHLALDLAQKNDLTALSGAWEPETKGQKIAVKSWYWTCGNEIPERTASDRINYRELAATGEITITDTLTIDYTYVAAQVQELYVEHDVAQLVVDSAYLKEFVDACDKIGFQVWVYEGPDKKTGREPTGDGLKIMRHAQGSRVVFEGKMLCMPVAVRVTRDGIVNGSIEIDNAKLTTICAANSVLVADGQNNEYFDKKRSKGRIDGMVTIAMAVNSATTSAGETATPIDEFLSNPIKVGF